MITGERLNFNLISTNKSALVHFFYEDTDFLLNQIDNYKSWLLSIIDHYSIELEGLNYIFCSDDYLLQINKEYLQHDYYTDIITFVNSESPLQTDIFISIDRIRDNAQSMGIPFLSEIHRVMVHGILHCAGFDDKTDDQKAEMRSLESRFISLNNVPRGTL